MRHLQAATATGLPPGTGSVALVVAVLAAGYAISCLLWPITNCRRCDGAGRHRSPNGKNWRACRKCKGSGGRIRTGRQILNAIIKTRRKGS